MPVFKPHTEEYSVVDPIKPKLDTNIIENGKLKNTVKESVLDAVSQISKIISEKIQKVWVVGSSLTFQYTPESDIDVTLFVDADEEELIKLNKLASEKFNEKIYIKKHPVNFHFNSGSYYKFKADAIYDIDHDKWIKKPEAMSEEELKNLITNCKNVDEFNEILEEYSKLKNLLENFDGNVKSLENILEQTFWVNYLFNKIRDIRREEFNEPSEKSIPSANYRCSNIIFKLLENYGLGNLSTEIARFIESRFKS